MVKMFKDDTEITYFGDVDTSKVTNIQHAFAQSTIQKLGEVDFSKAAHSLGMFERCQNLEAIPTPLDISNVYNAAWMFSECPKLKTVHLKSNRLGISMYMFNGCKNLTEVSLDSAEIINSEVMFAGCSSLEEVSLDVSKVTHYNGEFSGCSKLRVINLIGFGSATDVNVGAMSFDHTQWGIGSEEARKSLTDTLLTNSFDRAAAGLPTMRVPLRVTTKSLLTSEEIAAITAKGYTL